MSQQSTTTPTIALMLWIHDYPIMGNVVSMDKIVDPRQPFSEYKVGQKVSVKLSGFGIVEGVIGKIGDESKRKMFKDMIDTADTFRDLCQDVVGFTQPITPQNGKAITPQNGKAITPQNGKAGGEHDNSKSKKKDVPKTKTKSAASAKENAGQRKKQKHVQLEKPQCMSPEPYVSTPILSPASEERRTSTSDGRSKTASDIATCSYTKEQLLSLIHVQGYDDYEKATKYLFLKLYKRDEYYNKSLTGRAPNKATPAKEKLADPSRLGLIYEVIRERYGSYIKNSAINRHIADLLKPSRNA